MLTRKTWKTPAGIAPGLCVDLLKQPHLLIAGATGSGKSVLINSLIYTALYKAPKQVGFILIDPKRVELVDYKDLPHTLKYASEPEDIADTIAGTVYLMELRYKKMQKQRRKETASGDIYLIIDEFADLMTTQKHETLPNLCRIAQLGRAAHIHLIIATQRPTRDIVNGQIKVNMDSRIALRCPSPQDSRNIIDRRGAETLPRFGYGYYLNPEGFDLVKIPMTSPEAISDRVQWWQKQTKGLFRN